MSFADNIQFLRRREGMTQEELAGRLGVSRQSVSKWETGEAYPETEKILYLCDLFSVGMDDLMRGDLTAPNEDPAASATPSPEEAPSAQPTQTPFDGVANVDEGENEKVRRLRAIGGAVSGCIMTLSLLSYVLMGALFGLWHPGWIIFPFALSLCIFVDGLFAKEDEDEEGARLKPLSARIFGGLGSMTMPLAATIYVFIGCVWGIWHPSWVIFIIACALTGGLHAIASACAGRE